MSTGVVQKPVTVNICDVCGQEITKLQQKDPEEVGRLVGINEMAANADTTKHAHMRMFWPPKSRRTDTQKLRCYDFHTDCIKSLVEAAVRLREAAVKLREDADRQRAAKYERAPDL